MQQQHFPVLPNELPATGNVAIDLENAKLFFAEWPDRPKYPKLALSERTPENMRKQADILEAYNLKMEQYNAERANVEAHNAVVDKMIIDYIKEASGLYYIDPKYRKKVWEKAWEAGSGGGYYNVYIKLVDLIDIFN